MTLTELHFLVWLILHRQHAAIQRMVDLIRWNFRQSVLANIGGQEGLILSGPQECYAVDDCWRTPRMYDPSCMAHDGFELGLGSEFREVV